VECRCNRVLVVDDSALITQAAALLLRLLGFEPTTATSGDVALSIVARVQPIAAFIDLCLPSVSGWEVARQVRALPLRYPPKLFAITALPKQSVQARARAFGFDDVISKPFGREELQHALREP
jgi:CheY-like chemotaxis protein